MPESSMPPIMIAIKISSTPMVSTPLGNTLHQKTPVMQSCGNPTARQYFPHEGSLRVDNCFLMKC
jgi:hypothetical protein